MHPNRGVSAIAYVSINGTISYYHKDSHGDVMALTDNSGTITKNYQFDAFGNEMLETESDNPFRYCGEYYDAETGLIYLRNRYYDTVTGRFITEDPVKDGLNWYVYCANNPVIFMDPWGYWAPDGSDEIFRETNPIVYNALTDLTITWNNLDNLEKQGFDISDMKSNVSQLANQVRAIGKKHVVKEPVFIAEKFNSVEKVLYAQYPAQGRTFLVNGVLSRKKTEEFYGDGYRVNDDSDAFRHAYWNACLAKDIGANIAKLYTDAHEYGFPSNFTSESFLGTKMDLYNNAQGRIIGTNNPQNKIYEMIQNAVTTGKLYKIEKNQLVPTNNNMKFLSLW